MKLHLENNQSTMDWRHGSSGTVPVLQAQSIEFKPQAHQRTTKRNNNNKKESLVLL
jgi:hypothetical protein